MKPPAVARPHRTAAESSGAVPAVSVGEGVLDAMSGGFAGRVEGVFDGGFYVCGPAQAVFAVLGPQSWPGPLHLVAEEMPAMPARHDSVTVSDGVLAAGRTRVRVDPNRRWAPRLPTRLNASAEAWHGLADRVDPELDPSGGQLPATCAAGSGRRVRPPPGAGRRSDSQRRRRARGNPAGGRHQSWMPPRLGSLGPLDPHHRAEPRLPEVGRDGPEHPARTRPARRGRSLRRRGYASGGPVAGRSGRDVGPGARGRRRSGCDRTASCRRRSGCDRTASCRPSLLQWRRGPPWCDVGQEINPDAHLRVSPVP